MSDIYYLANRFFDVQVQNGTIYSLLNTGDDLRSQFVGIGKGYSGITLRYRSEDGILHEWTPWKDASFDDSVRVVEANFETYEGVAENEHLSVKVIFSLRGEKLNQTVEVKSLKTNVVLEDVCFAVPNNTGTKWGDIPGEKIMAHSWISGHGSHIIYTRCDGRGPILMMLPQDDTCIEFFTVNESRICYIYTCSKEACRIAAEKGSTARLPGTYRVLKPGEVYSASFLYTWARDYRDAKNKLVEYGLVDVDVAPGMTVPRDLDAMVHLRVKNRELKLIPQFEEKTTLEKIKETGDGIIYKIHFDKLGENSIKVLYGENRYMYLEFFVTEPVETMIKKRAAFIASKQIKNPELWYDGLFAEWNNETNVVLSPDNYDKIKGWRIYEVTCDDPGLSKPAFLSTKLKEYPDQEQVDALDYYIENFVWGGLQRTDKEEFPYGIYGIPDWYQNRNSKDDGVKGKLHIWRIYDYPHIMLMYYNMYFIARNYKNIRTSLTADEYLERAYRTALALFTIPYELDGWSAYKTGLYNELVIENIIQALYNEGRKLDADRLSIHWNRKIKYFINECKDIFASEYPFDTTGFESTHVIARSALKKAERVRREDRWNPPMAYSDAVRFMEAQIKCNIACRGYFEPAYYWYGSDYRANNWHYTLTYMSQMGGCSVLDYAINYADDPEMYLRLGYGSVLSSWALLNSGDEESNYGYWFPGKQNDGAASGGFEPLPWGETWLEQPHRRGAWYYSCEIDLGFCGGVRGAATVLAEDPVFGRIVYGGILESVDGYMCVRSRDGVCRRFHYVDKDRRLHLELNMGHFSSEMPIKIREDFSEIIICTDIKGIDPERVSLSVSSQGMGSYSVESNVEGDTKVFVLTLN